MFAISKLSTSKDLSRLVSFIALSGLGWLFDLGLFSFLLRAIELPAFWCNFISSVTAATLVYFVFGRTTNQNSSIVGVLAYIIYQFAIIIFFSACLAWLYQQFIVISWLEKFAGEAAKIVVTGPNLIMNFIVSTLFLSRFSK